MTALSRDGLCRAFTLARSLRIPVFAGRHLRPVAVFFMVLAVHPVVLSLNFRSITVQNRFALYLRCGLGVALESSVFPGLSCRHGTARCRGICE
ncbi:DUF1472 domain-containing protein [Salmonella enterica subsp. enterica serovar Give]|nr:DUF1472 domain-containing protein [Salmonella enterica subsp. enterica serovar Give]